MMTPTRKMAYIAILSAISFLLMYFQFPLIPAANFLQVDLSILPMLLGLLVLDVQSALMILLIRTLLKLFLNNGGVGTLIGLPMNVVALGIFIFALAVIWKGNPSLKQYLIATSVAILAYTLAMLVLNYVYAVPLYAKFANFDIEAILGLNNYLFAMVLPFNLLQGLIFSVTFYLLEVAVRPLLKKIN